MSYETSLQLNENEVQEIIRKVKEGKKILYVGETDTDPYGSGSHDRNTLSYDNETGYFILQIEFWASQYNSEPETTIKTIGEEEVALHLLKVYKSRCSEV